MKLIKILLLFLISASTLSGQKITGFEPFTGYGLCRYDAREVICLRKFFRNNSCFFLVVSPRSLDTEIIRYDSIIVQKATWDKVRSRFINTPYISALDKAELNSNSLQDAGYTHVRSSQKGIDLTIDLCPSKRPLDRIVFTDLIKELGDIERPVPLAVSVTGRWLNRHSDDLEWLEGLVKAKEISIVWINHSFNHFTSAKAPLQKNFMLAPGTDIDAEVLNTEIALLERNLIPSVFFRFPGLVSDRGIYDKILNFGLIPVGSDAWLAKGQKPGNGSIVLIHANGNEPLGIKDLFILLKNKREEALSGRWELFDLRESIVDNSSK